MHLIICKDIVWRLAKQLVLVHHLDWQRLAALARNILHLVPQLAIPSCQCLQATPHHYLPRLQGIKRVHQVTLPLCVRRGQVALQLLKCLPQVLASVRSGGLVRRGGLQACRKLGDLQRLL